VVWPGDGIVGRLLRRENVEAFLVDVWKAVLEIGVVDS
jgi:hypothetical protein